MEPFRGQRSKEKSEYFKRFGHPALADVYKNQFFALFNYQCFKCGAKEKNYQEYGSPPVLCINCHIPIGLGGHFIPGNLVSLCRICNSKKQAYHPEKFYSLEELNKLKPILDKQGGILDFVFDWDHWHRDPGGYLLQHGVDSKLIHEILNNPDHPYYIGSQDSGLEIFISLDVNRKGVYD